MIFVESDFEAQRDGNGSGILLEIIGPHDFFKIKQTTLNALNRIQYRPLALLIDRPINPDFIDDAMKYMNNAERIYARSFFLINVKSMIFLKKINEMRDLTNREKIRIIHK